MRGEDVITMAVGALLITFGAMLLTGAICIFSC